MPRHRTALGDKAGADHKPTAGELGSEQMRGVSRSSMQRIVGPPRTKQVLTAKLMKHHVNFSDRLLGP